MLGEQKRIGYYGKYFVCWPEEEGQGLCCCLGLSPAVNSEPCSCTQMQMKGKCLRMLMAGEPGEVQTGNGL